MTDSLHHTDESPINETEKYESGDLYTNRCGLHHYRTEIPNIIFHLNLSAYEFMLYSLYKRVAGDGGSCFMTVKNLLSMLPFGITTLREGKKKLEIPRK